MTREPIEIDGCKIPENVIVDFVLGAANRDPAHFCRPDQFDITRRDNRHLAFSAGRHFCLGAHLTRLEGEIAFRALSERFPTLKASEARSCFKPGSLLRGLEKLQVVV